MRLNEWLTVILIAVTTSIVGGLLLGVAVVMARDWYNGRSPLW